MINEINGKYGDSISPPVEDVGSFLYFARSVYSLVIPAEFAEFWRIQNGLEYDGNVFYHVDVELSDDINPLDVSTNNAIIASNIIWHGVEEQRRYTFLGDGNIDWFVYDIEREKYLILDKPSAEEMEMFDTFDEFFSAILSRWVDQR
ncbi:hypothetical protein J2Y69_000082 [Microbacterium resistens]|uniref:SMI1/KNR4 family protein n=1 Tax=Microbacterium resistens TaxID=156977 RepID=A0ABU1S7K0_9MICO|nr:hypothetical protein [Microbacterium resistens]